MIIRITRRTGFFGMGSPLQIAVDDKVITSIGEKQTKELDIKNAAGEVQLQIRFFLLKSPIFICDSKEELQELEIIMNPKMVSLYIALFALAILLPILYKTVLVSFFLVIAYLFFAAFQLKKAYLIRKVETE